MPDIGRKQEQYNSVAQKEFTVSFGKTTAPSGELHGAGHEFSEG